MTDTEIKTEATGTVVDSVEVTEATETELVAESPIVETTTETTVETTEPVASDEKIEAFNALAEAATKFREARSKVDEILLGSPIDVKPIETETEAEATETSIEEETKSPVLETEIAEAVDETASAEMAEMKEAIALAANAVTDAADQLVAIATRVKELEVGLLSAQKETEVYKSRVEELESKIVATEEQEKTALSAEIVELDSEVDPELLKGMTVQQLSAYRDTIERVSGKDTKGFSKKSVKADETETETTALSAPTKEMTRAEFIKSSLIPFCKKQERKEGGLF